MAISLMAESSGCRKPFPARLMRMRPGNQVGLLRQDVAVALDAGDAAGVLQSAQGLLQFLLAVGRQPS